MDMPAFSLNTVLNVSARCGTGRYGTFQSGTPAPCLPSQKTSSRMSVDTDQLWIDGIRELNQRNALVILQTVNAALTNKVKIIVIDLSQTVFLDSHGVGAFITLRNMMVRRGGTVRLLNPSPLVKQVLDLTRLHRVLDIVTSEQSLDR